MPAHRAREAAAEELGERLAGPPLAAVDAEIGAAGKRRQVGQQVLVQADRPRHRERADGAAVERRQAVELGRRQAPGASRLEGLDQPLELPPRRLALATEPCRFQGDLWHDSSRLPVSAEPPAAGLPSTTPGTPLSFTRLCSLRICTLLAHRSQPFISARAA